MKTWLCVLLALPACGAPACSPPEPRTALPSNAFTMPASVRVGVNDRGRLRIRRVPLEQYVEAASLSEFAPAAENAKSAEQMLEVQAIVARTYAVGNAGRHARDGYDLCDGTHCQLFQPGRLSTSRWATQAAAAVRQTRSEVLWFDGAPALAVFHADCGGRTSAAADVWGGTLRPYLVSRRDSDGLAPDAHVAWRFVNTRTAVLAVLNSDLRTRMGAKLDRIEVLDRDAAGRAERVALHGTERRVVRAVALRDVLANNFGARSIRSTWFTVRRDGETIVFDGRGFGHGVGLCQAGALARVRAGTSVAAVLQHYFPGTKLVKMPG